jgi:hypothetical protein
MNLTQLARLLRLRDDLQECQTLLDNYVPPSELEEAIARIKMQIASLDTQIKQLSDYEDEPRPE